MTENTNVCILIDHTSPFCVVCLTIITADHTSCIVYLTVIQVDHTLWVEIYLSVSVIYGIVVKMFY